MKKPKPVWVDGRKYDSVSAVAQAFECPLKRVYWAIEGETGLRGNRGLRAEKVSWHQSSPPKIARQPSPPPLVQHQSGQSLMSKKQVRFRLGTYGGGPT